MSGQRSDKKILSHRVLREMSLNPIGAGKQGLNGDFSMHKELEHYLEENHQLRVKCRKIDEIQKYAGILVENADQLKRQNEALQNRLSSLQTENERVKDQLKHANVKQGLFQQTAPKYNDKHIGKRMSEVEDNLQAIRMKQQMTNLKHNHQRVLSSTEQKHRSQVGKLQQQIKMVQTQALQTNSFLKSENELVERENQQLKLKVLESQEISNEYRLQIEKLNGQLKRYESVCQDYEDKMDSQYLMISKLESQSRESVAKIREENQELIMAIQKLQGSNAVLEKIIGQLKNEGANIILESDSLRKDILGLQQQIRVNLKTIDQLNSQMDMLKDRHTVQLQREHQSKLGLQQLMGMLQKDNVSLKRQKDDLSKQILTKQQEIEDLIVISSKLEQRISIMASATISLEEHNSKQSKQLEELLSTSDFQTHQIDRLQSEVRLTNNIKRQCQQQYNQLQRNLDITVENLQSQKARTIILQGDLQMTKAMLRDLQLENQRIKSDSNQHGHISQHLQTQKHEMERLYNQQKHQKQMCKAHIESLVKQVEQFQRLLRDLQTHYEGQNKKIKEEQRYLMQSEMRKEVQQIQQVMNERYNQMLNEYRDCFHKKIEVLQNQIQLINSSQVSQRKEND